MKKIQSHLAAPWLLALASMSWVACSGGDDTSPTPEVSPSPEITPTPTPTPEPAPIVPEGCDVAVYPSADDQTEVQEALITSAENDVVCLVDGPFKFLGELSIDKKGLTLRGINQPELDFSDQVAGGNGIHVISDDFIIEGLTVRNPAGDGIRATAVENVLFSNVKVLWDTSSTDNGGYGLYPVSSTGVIIEDSEVSGASDAGVYVGQSTQIIVRDNEVYGNVAGIEIENSTDAEVTRNHCYDNTGGILVFNLPELPVKDGKRSKVHNNLIEENNRENFAPEGNIVGLVPPGTGIMVFASDNNEINDNTIRGNVSVGVVYAFYNPDLVSDYEDVSFDAYPEGNYTHNNLFENNGTSPKGIIRAIMLDKGLSAPIPPMLWDGCVDPAKEVSPALVNCFSNNVDQDGAAAGFVDVRLCTTTGEVPSFDVTGVTCEHDTLDTLE